MRDARLPLIRFDRRCSIIKQRLSLARGRTSTERDPRELRSVSRDQSAERLPACSFIRPIRFTPGYRSQLPQHRRRLIPRRRVRFLLRRRSFDRCERVGILEKKKKKAKQKKKTITE